MDTGSNHTLVSRDLFICLPRMTMLHIAPCVQSISEHLDGRDLLAGANFCASKCILDFTTKTMTQEEQEFPTTLSPETDSLIVSADSIVPPTNSSLINEVLLRNREIFSSKKTLISIAPSLMLAWIDTGDHVPLRQNPYRMPLLKREKVEDCVEKMVTDKITQPSSSPWVSPITLPPKEDGGTWFCVDYRKLNSITRKDAYIPYPISRTFLTLWLRQRYFSPWI